MVRIISSAQLALMPKGTRVSWVKMHEDGSMDFNIQGFLNLGAKSILQSVDSSFINLVGELPDVYIEEGRVVTRPDEHSYGRDANFPHRFVLWDDV